MAKFGKVMVFVAAILIVVSLVLFVVGKEISFSSAKKALDGSKLLDSFGEIKATDAESLSDADAVTRILQQAVNDEGNNKPEEKEGGRK